MTRDCRNLQHLCERQAALSAAPAAKEALKELAEEYRRLADKHYGTPSRD